MQTVLDTFAKAQNNLVTQQSDFSLSAISEMVSNQSIDITPHYQRRDRWAVEKQSALIESFLINVPVPPVYLSEDDYGVYTVIDGKQRITAIHEFLSGRLKLKDMKEIPELNGFTFGQLPTQLKNALSIRPFIRVITLLKQSDPELKYEVFLRLNTGGEKLKAQEIRNVAYSGPLNNLLFELSENHFFRQQLKITSKRSTPYRNMDDLELVLRFLTMREKWQRFGTKISIGMDIFMADHRDDDVRDFRDAFNYAIEGCERIWGNHAFQKPINNGWQKQLIAPLWDAEMVAVSLIDEARIEQLVANQPIVLNAKRKLYEKDSAFRKSVSQSTGDTAAIRNRIGGMLDMLRTVEV
jgi:hypothetical protein